MTDDTQAIKEALTGFVHERLPTGHRDAGSSFVRAADFNRQPRDVRVRIHVDSDSTEISVFNKAYEGDYAIRFSPGTPAAVIAAAAAAVTAEVAR
jgi:hypothetical protein